jgi:RND family efflux transporter MFP subunit
MKKLLKSKRFWVFSIVAIAVIIVSAILITQFSPKSAEDTEPQLQTTKVRKGDLLVSAAGIGNVLSSAQADLAFRNSGVVAEIYITPGQQVNQGELLAVLDNKTQENLFIQAQAEIDYQFSKVGIASYEIEVVNAEEAYYTALGYANTLGKSIGSEDYLNILRSDVAKAEDDVATLQEKYNGLAELPNTDLNKVQTLAALSQAKLDLDDAKAVLAYYENEPNQLDSIIIAASLTIATTNLEEAKVALDIVKSGDYTRLNETLNASSGTSLEKLKQAYLSFESARIAYENTLLKAPFSGIVVNLNMVPGQSVGSNPVLTLASVDKMFVKFYMDETDLAGLKIGDRVLYTFNAYPETQLEGEVTLIEKALETIDGSPVVVVWGSLPEQPSFEMLVGMSLDAEVISGEVTNAIIIPVQALRELAPGSYAVFKVQADGSLELTPVTIGLRDFANVEIVSGLQLGDLVSTGTADTN